MPGNPYLWEFRHFYLKILTKYSWEVWIWTICTKIEVFFLHVQMYEHLDNIEKVLYANHRKKMGRQTT